ncbi:nucleotidyltransferase [Leifsonia sp. YAF41]|uniref:nucleotidyltransferase domain-containing protein n=1 Tax=Leifsonia sp. YAF41 TaxID=3233086 RepID=UPI003F9907CF
MSFSTAEQEALLSSWIKPSSTDEKTQQDRAERMVADALSAHPGLASAGYRVYAKGSYANNTNVRRDSDVDIAVEFTDCQYYDPASNVTLAEPKPAPYEGDWTPARWRQEVVAALKEKFGSSSVDMSGSVAINVPTVIGSRPSIDIVPSFKYVLYDNSTRTSTRVGSCVFPKSGVKIVNWPQQQYDNGVTKNTATGGRYKYYARALKNAENKLAADGVITALPSYFMECLIYNVDDESLTSGDLNKGFKASLLALYQRLQNESADRMLEPNRNKYLFNGTQKWTLDDGLKLVAETWTYMGYGK